MPRVDLSDVHDDVIGFRGWTGSDVPFLQEASVDASIQRYSLSRSRPLSSAEAGELLAECDTKGFGDDSSGRPVGSLVIVDAATGSALGQCGIDGWTPDESVQVGYWLAPKARGRGIATRALVQLTDWLTSLGARRVFLTVVEDNHASVQVALRAGYRPEGPTGEETDWQGRTFRVLSFALVADDWRQRGTSSG